jgi:2,4-dienoyl-CoA reductase-like NADH-dependent reductase (Old Yellow Enzyme family)
MCQFASADGFPSDWHLVHLGSRAVGGAALVVVEATAVAPAGRISPADSGIYLDAHVEPFARIARFLRQHGAAPGIQLAHAGRKASMSAPWDGDRQLPLDGGGWEMLAPSAMPYSDDRPRLPREMTLAEIDEVQHDFVAAARRALAAGFEWLELHFAHGYLAHEFFSPLANRRTDAYGGSFDNRARFLVEICAQVRAAWPERLPLAARLSATDWTEGGVTVEESSELARRLRDAGLDMVDVSHGFIGPDLSRVPWGPGFLLPVAGEIRRATGLPTAVGWLLTEPEQAEAALRDEHCDLVMLARASLRDPYWPYHAAVRLGCERPAAMLPTPYAHPLGA